MKPLTAYSLRAERVAFTLGAILAVLIVVHVLAMQANFNPALGLDVVANPLPGLLSAQPFLAQAAETGHTGDVVPAWIEHNFQAYLR